MKEKVEAVVIEPALAAKGHRRPIAAAMKTPFLRFAPWVLVLVSGCSSSSGSDAVDGNGADASTTGDGLLPEGDSSSGLEEESSSSGDAWQVDTDDGIQPPEIEPPTCDDVALEPQPLAVLDAEAGDVQAIAMLPGGSAVVMVDGEVLRLDADGQLGEPFEFEAGLHPTALGGDGHGNVYVGGVLDVDLQGDVDAFIRRYVGGELAVHVEIDLVDAANETPRSIAAAPGYVGLVTLVEHDPVLFPALPNELRLERMSSSLELQDSVPFAYTQGAHAIDADGTLYAFEEPGVLSATGIDGSVLWSVPTDVNGSVDISIGPEEVWIATRGEIQGAPPFGRVVGLARGTGSTLASFELAEASTREGTRRDAPAAIAAHPCGGATLLSMTALDTGREQSESMALSHLESDGTATPISLDTPFSSGIFFDSLFAVGTAADGASLALFPISGGSQAFGF